MTPKERAGLCYFVATGVMSVLAMVLFIASALADSFLLYWAGVVCVIVAGMSLIAAELLTGWMGHRHD